jgi:hypothetical protein
MSLCRVLLALLASTALVTACTEKNPALPDGAVDGDGSVIADANNDPCTANATSCADDVLTTCNAEGSGSTNSDCALGCFDEVRCAKLDPSNGLAAHLDMAAEAADLILTGDATIDTGNETISDETGALVVSGAVVTGGPVDVFVVRVKSLTAGNIAVTGTRALAIVSDGDIQLNGGLNVSAVFLDSESPGGIDDNTTCGDRDANGSNDAWPGGGGGGYGGSGGLGGSAPGHNGGTGSAVNGSASIVPLRGGCTGGEAIGSLNSSPGTGGGAVQLISNTSILVSSTGHLAANGAGARGSAALVSCTGNPCFAGDGGGSGGAILLEAPSVSLATGAGLFANGGGGSCAYFTNTPTAASGEGGLLSEARAAGGVCTGSNVGNGGLGGAGATTGGGAGTGTSLGTDMDAGGGGGGVGRIRINLPTGATTDAIEGTVSPAASFGALATR